MSEIEKAIKELKARKETYEKCGIKTCLANFDGECRQPYLQCAYRKYCVCATIKDTYKQI